MEPTEAEDGVVPGQLPQKNHTAGFESSTGSMILRCNLAWMHDHAFRKASARLRIEVGIHPCFLSAASLFAIVLPNVDGLQQPFWTKISRCSSLWSDFI